MPCFTCITSRNKVIVYDHPDQLQGQYDPETRATSYIMPPKHLSHGRSPGCKQPSKFFDLPGEVRNQIYELVVEPENYEVAWLDKIGGSLTHWKHKTEKPNWLNEFEFRRQFKDKRVREAKWADQFTKPDLDPKYIERRRREMRQPRHHVKTPNSFFDAVKGPAAMLRVSKQIHDEFAQFFYSSVSVSFQNHKILTHWLGLLTPVARKNLTKLYLQHQGYGEPKMFKNVQWKEKHDKLWAKRLKTVVEEFPSKRLPPLPPPQRVEHAAQLTRLSRPPRAPPRPSHPREPARSQPRRHLGAASEGPEAPQAPDEL